MMNRCHLDTGPPSALVPGTRYIPKSAGLADEPITVLIGSGNRGGFRIVGSPTKEELHLVGLYTTSAVEEWPDRIDREAARLTYYGDNRKPGRELHATTPRGNWALKLAFDWTHLGSETRERVPPFFVFSATDEGRAVDFEGVAAPGAPGMPEEEDLVARWRTKDGQRFQNYEATFTFLDIPEVPRSWIEDAREGNAASSKVCPPAWTAWIRDRTYETASLKR